METFKSFYGMDESYFEAKGAAFTSSEIYRQPELWRELASLMQTKKDEIVSFLSYFNDRLFTRIIITGAGSSAYIGETAAFIIGKTTGIHCEAIPTTDIVSSPYSVLLADVPTLLVSVARSGNSPESVGAVKYARSIVRDLWELAVICDGNSALAKATSESSKNMILVMPEGSNDKGFAMTSSVTCMVLACLAFFNNESLKEFCDNIGYLADFIEQRGPGLVEISRRWAEKNYERLIIIGSGCCKGIAREAALKSMELTAGMVFTAYESALGFRHGPKAVIKDNTLTIHFISPDPLSAKYDMDLLKEICKQKKGNKIVALSTTEVQAEVDEDILIPVADKGAATEIYFGICGLVFCQLLAMFKSIN
ncbi:MAG: SIS domain-containing protein, partial [Treponema sp.]|nr:SIS domain-containing protein [Treponema sp.]